jgi:hypothetical protein
MSDIQNVKVSFRLVVILAIVVIELLIRLKELGQVTMFSAILPRQSHAPRIS